MKIKLSNQGEIQILSTSEAITIQDIKVLKAGVGNLFKNGKNKVIVEIAPGTSLPSEVLRELAVLDIFARELAGKIVVSGINEQTKKQIEAYGRPPIVHCFVTREEALAAFKPEPKPEPKAEAKPATEKAQAPAAAAPAPAAAAPAASSTGDTSAADAEIQKLREQIKNAEAGELGALRKKVAQLEEENATLKAQIITLFTARATAPDNASLEEKIKALETKLEEKLQEAKK